MLADTWMIFMNADCATHAISKIAQCHLSKNIASTYCATLPKCLQGYDVLGLPGHPDLSPIEHVWDALGRQLQPYRDNIDDY
ncbi:hypothetical protein TNCV_116241 [Trichonephila clavipes]|nr:hypothetical protein TNCV_116241 [Trichonephila clavipes]